MRRLDQPVNVADLRLDPENPRLPEEVQGGTQAELLRYLWENDVLEELIGSYLSNGYFESEPLIALPPKDGLRTVVEGNRRLAALMILHQLPPAIEADIEFDEARRADRQDHVDSNLRAVPVVEAASVDDVAAYLGFRHISGLKTWNSEAKARWLYQQVELRARDESQRGVFYDVGRQVGSNARGVRSSYIAFGLLRLAREESEIEPAVIDFVSRQRFGVWLRLLGTANVLEYIGLSTAAAVQYQAAREQIEAADLQRLGEVLGDLVPTADRRAVLADSRDVTDYSDVIAYEPARQALRDFGNLTLAVEVARKGDLVKRLRDFTRTLELLTLDVKRYEVGHDELVASRELAATARALDFAVQAAAPEV